VSLARQTRNGTARRSSTEWTRLAYDRDCWHAEAVELEAVVAAMAAELYDIQERCRQLDHRGLVSDRRVLATDWRELAAEQRKGFGRRQFDHQFIATDDVGQWTPRLVLCEGFQEFRP
jgi:hypothetical protein